MAGCAPADGVLERMARAMAHRGPDGERTWRAGRAGLAFRRLAVIDLDERSMQPMHLGDLHLAFNGEIYNYRELRAELRDLGHAFRTEGDAEVLLHAWAEWDEGALDRLNGMFAFAVWDARREQLTLAVDPFGEKPLYVARERDTIAFASDVRALRAARPELGGMDEHAAQAFLALGALPAAPETFFAGIERVPAAHLLRWRAGEAERVRYWWPRRVAVPAHPQEAAEELRSLLRDAVRLRLRSDVAVGTSLSGGVDSSTIATLVGELAGDQSRHAFTARFAGFERDEWDYASLTADAAGVTHHHAVEPTADDLLGDLEALVADQEEPFLSTSIYAQWRVMRAARDAGVTVLLDGQGADELLAGYTVVEPFAVASRGVGAIARTVQRTPGSAAGIARALVAGRAPAALGRWERVRAASPYARREVARCAAAEFRDHELPVDERDPLRRKLLLQTFSTSLPHLLRYADRNSMAHSREVRLPFLDRRVAEFGLSAPSEILVRDGVRKRVLRDAARGRVPDAVLDRRDKVGFETPEAHWLAAPAGRARIAEVVLDRSTPVAGLVDRASVEQDLAAGRWRSTPGIWRATCLALWSTTVRDVPHGATVAA